MGAGHNGLVCAALLARRGLDVLVLEQRDRPGGAAATEELVPGFRFSTCAHVLAMLHERVLADAGVTLAGVELLPQRPRTAVLPDGTVFREDASSYGLDTAAYVRWREERRALARVVDRFLLGEPPSTDALRAAAEELGVVEVYDRFATATYTELLAERFVSDEARTLNGPTLPVDPSLPGAPLAAAYFDTADLRDDALKGVPRGGMGAVADAFARAALDAGAEVRCGAPVERILVEDGAAAGVALAGGEEVRARAVVSNADPKLTLLGLLPCGVLEPRVAGSVGALVVAPPSAKLHCALREAPDVGLLCDDPRELGVVHVYTRYGALPLEIQIPTFADPDLADGGGHTVSIFAPDAREFDLDAVAAVIPNLPAVTEAGVLLGPRELEQRTGLTDGCIHHVTHIPAQSFLGRGGPETPVPQLYLCGAGTWPGGELSGVPGWNCAELLTDRLLLPARETEGRAGETGEREPA